jgi:hypothetical protein
MRTRESFVKRPASLACLLLLAAAPVVFAEGGGPVWAVIPAYVSVSTPQGSTAGLGCGASAETMLYGEYVAGGVSFHTAWSEYFLKALDVGGHYMTLGGRLGFGHMDVWEGKGIYFGASYGVLIADNGGEDEAWESHFGGAWGGWMHLSAGEKTAFDFGFQGGGGFTVSRMVLVVFRGLALNFAALSGPGINGVFVYPGICLRG